MSVAFVWDGEKQDNYDVYVKPLEGGSPLRITTDPAGDGSPAWSADGRSIAFIRYSEKPGVSGVYIAPSFGGQERKVVAVSALDHLFDRHLPFESRSRA
jgi:Tol biopolymer transport system component